METGKETPNHDKLIDDYLFSGYKPDTYESTFDSDQQFAKPIEDEDMFASVECDQAREPNRSKGVRDKYKELAKGIVPRKFAADCDEDGMIEIEIAQAQPERISNATAIFDKAGLKRVKDRYGLYKGQKLFWDNYNDYLHKKISADKRKQWDSLQLNLDRYDDEEELMVDPGNGDDDNHRDEGELHAEDDESKEDGDENEDLDGDEEIDEEGDEEGDEDEDDDGHEDVHGDGDEVDDVEIKSLDTNDTKKTSIGRSKWIDDDDEDDD